MRFVPETNRTETLPAMIRAFNRPYSRDACTSSEYNMSRVSPAAKVANPVTSVTVRGADVLLVTRRVRPRIIEARMIGRLGGSFDSRL